MNVWPGGAAPGPLTRQLRDRYWASHEDPRYSTPVRYDEPDLRPPRTHRLRP